VWFFTNGVLETLNIDDNDDRLYSLHQPNITSQPANLYQVAYTCLLLLFPNTWHVCEHGSRYTLTASQMVYWLAWRSDQEPKMKQENSMLGGGPSQHPNSRVSLPQWDWRFHNHRTNRGKVCGRKVTRETHDYDYDDDVCNVSEVIVG